MNHFAFKDKEDIFNFLDKEGRSVKFVRIIFPDILGREMNFTIPTAELKSTFEVGKGFDGSSVEGFMRVEESDLVIVPDPKTFRVLPWNYESEGIWWKEAVIFGDIYLPNGEHFLGDSRYILKKTLKKTEKFGKLYCGPELEFFIFSSDKEPKMTDRGGYFYGGRYGELRKTAQLYLGMMGIATDYDHHEATSSQHEIDLKYNDALSIADSVVLAKYIIKRVARKSRVYASFMPKPITGVNGSGMHIHLSLWKAGKNLFFGNKKGPTSDLAKKYIMGLIKYGREIQAGLNQWVNSYKRLIPGYEAPVYIAWGQKNRSAYIRVPQYQPSREEAARIELRSPDPTCNIYLALSLIQVAGSQGIKENLKFLPAVEENIFEMARNEKRERKILSLSKNLKEALEYFKKSELVKQTLGEHLFNKFIQNKEFEYSNYLAKVSKRYEKKVSPYEIEHYLSNL